MPSSNSSWKRSWKRQNIDQNQAENYLFQVKADVYYWYSCESTRFSCNYAISVREQAHIQNVADPYIEVAANDIFQRQEDPSIDLPQEKAYDGVFEGEAAGSYIDVVTFDNSVTAAIQPNISIDDIPLPPILPAIQTIPTGPPLQEAQQPAEQENEEIPGENICNRDFCSGQCLVTICLFQTWCSQRNQMEDNTMIGSEPPTSHSLLCKILHHSQESSNHHNYRHRDLQVRLRTCFSVFVD